ncbi:ATP synthase subunit-like protein [Panicum miliaceum]|uniref:ATP synthase subunit-like protein n=1 Tax=Panicum miliaceum TaxID=4540 RepID=A0A3L6QBQ9_PANMI|nr:ATP synthase subunit-like protein [Panicum miliaceum]
MSPQVHRSSEISGAAREPTTDMAINGEGNHVAELNPGFYELGRNHQRRGRGVTINEKLSKLRARGIPLDLHFPQQFGKVCGRHASVFKSEVTVCIRQDAPLRVMKWKDMDNAFPGTTAAIWNFLRDKFPEISVGDKGYVMAQVERQYNVRRSRLHTTYRTTKRRPSDVAPEDWQWLIENLWTDEKFKKRSETNSRNRGQ